ncbi:hypothetical protein Trco_001771 [Trichoderma cornu-damae]|uniref:Uncharacterized protein n=1 Tax=Trichoderma cornu-damae TaxID=654480 RepID=A0A9P8QN43_9HYPO|nr:hypothetical protein Trco_001771 [Trichoderma cornu-damae]
MSDPRSSPAASLGSGTTTNPNTQSSDALAVGDLPSEDQDIVSGDQMAMNSTPSPSNVSRQQDYDIQPTWPGKIDRTKIRAHARWHPNQKMDNILLDIHWAGQQSCAFFKLHTRLRLNNAPGTSKHGHINVYVFIYPERIHRLLFAANPQYTPFGPSTVSLTFEFSRPPALILPKTHVGFEQEAEDAIRSLRNLVQQSDFTIYALLPRRSLSAARLQQFCEDVTGHKATTISSLTNWKTLYQAHGPKAYQAYGVEVIEGDGLLLEPVLDQDDAAASGLPVYQEMDANVSLTRPTKRKRASDESSTEVGQTVQLTDNVALIGKLLDAKLAAYERKMEDMFSAHERRVKKMLSTHMRKVEAELDAYGSNMVDELTETIQKKIKDEMEEAQECILEQISSMPVQAHFTFPNHPYL